MVSDGVGASAGAFLFPFADVMAFEAYLVAGVLVATIRSGTSRGSR